MTAEITVEERISIYNGSLEFQHNEYISTKWQEQFIVENPGHGGSRIRSNGQETEHATKEYRRYFKKNMEGSITLKVGKAATRRTIMIDGDNASGFTRPALSPQVTLTGENLDRIAKAAHNTKIAYNKSMQFKRALGLGFGVARALLDLPF